MSLPSDIAPGSILLPRLSLTFGGSAINKMTNKIIRLKKAEFYNVGVHDTS